MDNESVKNTENYNAPDIETTSGYQDTVKLATLGKLTAKIAHELNNPLDGILRYINLTLRILENEKQEKPKQYLEQCRDGIMKMINITRELLEFSRNTCASSENCSVHQIIDEAIKILHNRIESSEVHIHKNYSDDLGNVHPDNLFQVFINLIKNALDAMPSGGHLYISTEKHSDNMLKIELRDTGTGFNPSDKELIFEPFYTTKEKGKGTGLGLAICKEIIHRNNGIITASSTKGQGSTFFIYLPLT